MKKFIRLLILFMAYNINGIYGSSFTYQVKRGEVNFFH